MPSNARLPIFSAIPQSLAFPSSEKVSRGAGDLRGRSTKTQSALVTLVRNPFLWLLHVDHPEAVANHTICLESTEVTMHEQRRITGALYFSIIFEHHHDASLHPKLTATVQRAENLFVGRSHVCYVP